MFDSEVPAWPRTDEPRRWSNAAGEFPFNLAPLALTGLVVAVLVAAMATQSTIEAPPASADASGTIDADTQRTTDVGLRSHQDGSVNPGEQLTLGCLKSGQGVTGFSRSVAPECNSASPSIDAGRAGRTRGVNPGTEGQCTWGAAQKWFEASGSYPALAGDAMSWSDAATAAGWTVSDDPRDRSIVVFQPGVAGAGSVGHVAWVDSVAQRPEGQLLHVTEMNNSYLGGVGVFNDRDIMDVSGMSYILLP